MSYILLNLKLFKFTINNQLSQQLTIHICPKMINFLYKFY